MGIILVGIIRVEIFLGGSCPGRNFVGEIFRVGVFLVGSRPVGIFWVEVFLGGKCPGGTYPGWEFFGGGVFQVGIVLWQSSGWQFSGWEFSCYLSAQTQFLI